MPQSNITFCIFSFNEEKRIEYAVRNLIKFGEVIVLDDGSTDKTGEIVERLGGRFVRRPKNEKVKAETPEMLKFVEENVNTPWIYWGFADNILPKTLLEKMAEISCQEKIKCVSIPVFTYLWGDTKNIYVKASYPCFFRKSMVSMDNPYVHTLSKFLGKPEEQLNLPMKPEYAMRHFSLYDAEKFLSGHWRYAKIEAEQKFAEGKRLTPFYLFGSMFNYMRIFWGGIRSGMRGILVSLLYGFFRIMMSTKLYELEHGLNLETMEAEYAKEKQKLVEEVENEYPD